MFSPEVATQSARGSLRNPRRRQRISDGPQQQQPRRKRSKLSDDAFHAQADALSNGNGSVTMNGHVSHGPVEDSMVIVDMPVREKKAPAKRVLKDDIALYLNKNEIYSLKRLPSFPTALRNGSTPFRASALPSAGLALALTPDNALIWDYNAFGASAKALVLPLPSGLKGSDPLPLGAIVRNGPTNDFGVVAVAPSTGKIVFWENVDSAEARSHFPQRAQGVETSVKLYSGERITGLVDVDHAGYILIFSTGRLAQITLRDSQGRPSITATILSAPNGSGSSFFSLKGLLGGAIRKPIASVKARASESKGQMEVITATKNGLFQLWDLSWSGQQIFKREIDMHADVLAAIQQGTAPETRSQHDAHILDFAIMEEQKPQGAVSLLALVALSGRDMLDYFLLELDLSDITGTVSRVIPLKNFRQSQLPKEPVGTLMLPYPGHTAFVQFPGAIVVASLAAPEASPEAQLFSDSGRSILPFQDTIYFKEDANVRIVGHALEHSNRKDKIAKAVLLVQDYGVLVLAALPGRADDEGNPPKVTAFSKLTQATFFSTVPGTIVDFTNKSRYDFDQTKVEKAALAISARVLSSSFEQLEYNFPSMDEQLHYRQYALHTLNAHLRSEYPPLSFQGKWQLLCHAEKLCAAHQLWKWYQNKLQDQQAHPEAYPEQICMSDIIKALHERYKTKPDPEKGETDRVRQFFLKDIDSLDILLPWGWNHLRLFYINSDTKERASVLQRLSEADDVMLVVLQTAFSFRQERFERYGLDPESLHYGVMKAGHGYDLLPNHIWTSSHNIVSSLRSLIDVGRNLADDSFEAFVSEDLSQKIGKDNPRLVRMCCQAHIERFQWALEQSDEKKREMGRKLREEWNTNVRPAHIYGLMDIGLATEGMNLAEIYRDMATLVNLIWDESTYLEASKLETQSKMEQAEISVKLNRIKERIARYFEEFGDEFAEAFYSKHIREGQSSQLFDGEFMNQPALTRFLRADPSRVRLCWINEIVGERDYTRAANALFDSARKENNVWCAKVELSIAKLALLCTKDPEAEAAEQQNEESRPRKVKKQEVSFATLKQRLEYTEIQDRLYERLLPTITSALDDESAVQLLMAEFGQGRLVERPALQSLLRQGFDDLVHHRVVEPSLMIDVLTLMTYEETDDPTDIVQSNEFLFALRVLSLFWETIHRTSRQGLKGLIWKRLCIKDNWAEINDTRDVTDEAVQDFLMTTAAGWTFKGLLKMIADDLKCQNVWPPVFNEMFGAGSKDGELCIRFPSEDLRTPIIKDNVLDEAILHEYVEKHRLSEWFAAAARAGQNAYRASMNGDNQAQEAAAVESDESESVAGIEESASEVIAEPAADDTFEGDDEQSVADQDVEMQDS